MSNLVDVKGRTLANLELLNRLPQDVNLLANAKFPLGNLPSGITGESINLGQLIEYLLRTDGAANLIASLDGALDDFNTAIENIVSDTNLSADQKLVAMQTYINGLNVTAQQKLDIINGLVVTGNTEISNLQQAIQVAAAAGAGANGWTSALVLDSGLNKTQDLINAYVYPKLQRENVSVQDFMTNAEYAAWKANSATADMARPIQAFFNAIATKDYGTVYCSGSFAVSSGLTLGGSAGCLTKQVIGNMSLTALNAIDTMLVVQAGSDFKWQGSLAVTGTGSVSYASRTCRIGIAFGGTYSASRNVFTAIIARRFSQVGVACRTLTTLSNYGDVRVSDCGSGYSSNTYSLTANWSTKVDSGTSGSTGQLSSITVDVLPPAVCETSIFVVINNEVYYVDSVNTQTNTISVFPWIDLTLTSGTLRYLFGAGVYGIGGDASVNHYNKIDAVRCSIAYYSCELYPAIVDNLVTQVCGVGLGLGGRPSAAHVGGQINGFYCENNDYDIMRVTRANMGKLIASEYAFNFAKIAYPCAMRDISTNSRGSYANLDSIAIQSDGRILSQEQYAKNYYGSSVSVDVTSKNRAIATVYSSASSMKQYTLIAPNISLNQAFGYEYRQLVQFGTGANGAPSAANGAVFTAPDGYTVNGGTTASFSGFSAAAVFHVYFLYASNAFIISCTTLLPLNTSVTYDPPSLATATQQSTTVTLVGAKLGDNVSVSFSRVLSGTRMWAEVTAADTITVYHRNDTGVAVDLASGTLKVKIL